MPGEHFDVLVIGAGLAGVNAGFRLQERCPTKTYAILEGRAATGGTWDTFRFPGVRCDSDIYTLGYPFHPWKGAKAIPDGQEVLDYVREVAARYGVDRHVRLGRRVVQASWSSARSLWTVDVELNGTDGREQYTCRFLHLCTGYFKHERGIEPVVPDRQRFQGVVVHPQRWPSDLDYSGKRVVVVGSGATATTIVPAMAEAAEQVTMLQRSPTYYASQPSRDLIASLVRSVLPARAAHHVSRAKNIFRSGLLYYLCRRWPKGMAKGLLRQVARKLPAGYDVATHFTPRYPLWDQRLCVTRDGDLFDAIKSGKASIATGEIDAFTETGLRLRSGEQLAADIVVMATGLDLVPCGGIRFEVDAKPMNVGDTFTYRGAMLSGLPNLAWSMGYINMGWTLRADLTAKFVCRVVQYMDRHGHASCTPVCAEQPSAAKPLIALKSGYVMRTASIFPKSGAGSPWVMQQYYLPDALGLRFAELDDGALKFTPAPGAVQAVARA